MDEKVLFEKNVEVKVGEKTRKMWTVCYLTVSKVSGRTVGRISLKIGEDGEKEGFYVQEGLIPESRLSDIGYIERRAEKFLEKKIFDRILGEERERMKKAGLWITDPATANSKYIYVKFSYKLPKDSRLKIVEKLPELIEKGSEIAELIGGVEGEV